MARPLQTRYLTVTVAALCLLLGACGTGLPTRTTGTDPSDGVSRSGAVTGSSPASALVASIPTAAMPADRAGPSDAGCASTTPAKGWTAAENARPGTRLPSAPATTTPGQVVGYLDHSSAVCGDTVQVHLSGSAQSVRLAAYRLGWYHGAGARLVWTSAATHLLPRPTPPSTPVTHLIDPQWAPSVAVPVTTAWPPGLYALVPQSPTPEISARPAVRPPAVGTARVRAASGGPLAAGPIIPLVVRDDSGREPVLFMASTLTWNAYDDWGGWSLYHGPVRSGTARVADRARVVSLQRPLTGSGYDQFQYMDLTVVRWLESLGVDVAYTTDLSVDARPSQLLQHAELVVGGHSEYWTTRMYDAAQAALGDGVNVALLGANNLWWHVRVEDDGTREVVYRVAAEDPLSATDPAQTTVEWSQAPLHRDAAALTGQTHAGIGVQGGLELLRPPGWFTAGTRLRSGTLLPGAVGNEADGYNPRARRPLTLEVLAAGVLDGSHGPVLVTTNYATAPSGAAVFSAGSTDWSCALGPRCASGPTPSATATAVRALTRNVILAFAEPRAGQRNPSVPVLPVPAAQLQRMLPAQAVGTYGGAEPGEGTSALHMTARHSTTTHATATALHSPTLRTADHATVG